MSTPPSYLVLDIETVPDREVHTPPDSSSLSGGADRPFPPLFACKPVVIGVLWMDESYGLRRIGTIGEGKDEAAMLADFSDFMTARRPCLVTWNGRGFDLPVLALRGMRHGLQFPWYYRDTDVRYRYSEKGHLDLCDHLSDHGAASRTPMAGAAKLIGMPGKDGVDGSQVEGLYRAGQLEALRMYCLSDVIQTAFLFLRYRLLVGQMDRAAYRHAATALLTGLATDGRFTRLLGSFDRSRLLLETGDAQAAAQAAVAAAP